jgi:two-component system chemotaxis sensor kinase CheA
MDKLTEQYRKQFYGEAGEILERINEDILRAEADPEDRELLNAIFRGIHTIKGSAGSFDLDDIAAFAHHLEGLLSALRDGRIELSPERVDVILAGADHIGKMVDDCSAGRTPQSDRELIERIRLCGIPDDFSEAQGDKAGDAVESGPDQAVIGLNLPPGIRDQFTEAARMGLYVFRIRVCYTSEMLENGYDPLVFLRNLHGASTAYAVSDPGGLVDDLEKFSPVRLYLSPTLYVATALTASDIQDLTFDPSLIRVDAVQLEYGGMEAEPLRDFVDGAVEMLESMEKAVIDYETSGSRESLNEIFRVVHNVKGDADLIGLEEITVFAHALESLLDRLRSGNIHRTFALVDVILQSVDFLRQSVLKLGQGIKIPEFPPVFETLKQYAAMKDGMDRKFQILKDVSPEMTDVFNEQVLQYKAMLREYGSGSVIDETNAKIIHRALAGLISASRVVNLKTLETQAQKAMSSLSKGEMTLYAEAVEKITTFIDSLAGESPVDAPERFLQETPRDDKNMSVETKTMRIEEGKVDHFTNLVGELLIARNTYAHLIDQLAADPDRIAIKSLRDNLRLFSRLTNDIHHGVMSLRMIPVRKIFSKFTRTVRDISRRQKKNIRLMTGGGDIEIDKKVADMLSEPLVHLVRNACDHGIESIEARKALGKSEEGTLVISATQEGSSLCISVVDDGRGIDRQTIYEAARRAEYQVESPDDPNLLDLLFHPGFSTSDRVSDISGRGVGLDVVKTAITSLGGIVRIVSTLEKGTEVSLAIPTTIGIDTVLFVESRGETYAIPLEHIVETLKLPSRAIRCAGQRLLFHHRGEVLPAEYLTAILEKTIRSGRESGPLLTQSSGILPVVIIKTSRGKYGLIVDRLKKNMEVAMKPLPGVLAGMELFSGVTIMGDGKVMLVLNPDKVF